MKVNEKDFTMRVKVLLVLCGLSMPSLANRL